MQTTTQEQQLIDAIKAKPDHQVFAGRLGVNVVIVQTLPNKVRQQSVWLGRKNTIQNLQEVLEA